MSGKDVLVCIPTVVVICWAIRFCHKCSTFIVKRIFSMVIVNGQLKIPGAGYTEPSALWQYCCYVCRLGHVTLQDTQNVFVCWATQDLA